MANVAADDEVTALAKYEERSDRLERAAEKLLGGIEEKEKRRTALWIGLAIGLGVAALAGLIVLLLRRREDRALGGTTINNYLADVQHDQAALLPPPSSVRARPSRQRAATFMRTITLPSLTVANSAAVRLCTARDVPYRVRLRPTMPPGAWAIVSTDAGELNSPSFGGQGNTLIIPVGGVDEVIIQPRQPLYAKGNVPGVDLSVVASEAPDVDPMAGYG